jgi:hypothetical protein
MTTQNCPHYRFLWSTINIWISFNDKMLSELRIKPLCFTILYHPTFVLQEYILSELVFNRVIKGKLPVINSKYW